MLKISLIYVNFVENALNVYPKIMQVNHRMYVMIVVIPLVKHAGKET